MKETYLVSDRMESFIAHVRQELGELIKRPRLHFAPGRSALLVLDMQCYFLEPASHAFIPSAGAVLPAVLALVQAYQLAGLPVFFTQHSNTPENAGMMSAWWQDLIQPDGPAFRLHPELDQYAVNRIHKTQYDAFHQTPLEGHLRGLGVQQVVICGVMTHLCCETTARSAFMRGFEVFFPMDGTADYNHEFHLAALKNLAHGFACLPTVAELLEELEHLHAG